MCCTTSAIPAPVGYNAGRRRRNGIDRYIEETHACPQAAQPSVRHAKGDLARRGREPRSPHPRPFPPGFRAPRNPGVPEPQGLPRPPPPPRQLPTAPLDRPLPPVNAPPPPPRPPPGLPCSPAARPAAPRLGSRPAGLRGRAGPSPSLAAPGSADPAPGARPVLAPALGQCHHCVCL